MALGDHQGAMDPNSTTANNNNTTNNDLLLNEKKSDEKKSGRNQNLDPERGANGAFASKYGSSDRTVGGRIGPVLGHLAGYDFGSDDSGSDILGKQLEMEAGDAIQYRTCSWQKVSSSLVKTREGPLRITSSSLMIPRLRLSSSRSISAWLSCHFRTHIPSLAWFQVLS
jgi:hypothetical protein